MHLVKEELKLMTNRIEDDLNYHCYNCDIRTNLWYVMRSDSNDWVIHHSTNKRCTKVQGEKGCVCANVITSLW
jgi:hypothetical protein